ncbi:hypothetical protein CYQ88_03470 [Hydrogenovibrio sp. SC-1]|uniref:site-specific integrase n=1 Tax=Hydrogenovibrio sp. SC-1 TaxID=2065820 RepID=UPI000C7B048F|nr:site-specific integrase [Hydrogenovibrio sp. SC-1]PLA74972.1 hypothetical protein CYQ88_03470 [Hydrogenovibrio sp. SC-1]
MTAKEALTKHVNSILEASNIPINAYSVRQVLLALNLTNEHIYNLKLAVNTLKNILAVHDKQIVIFQELELAFKEIELNPLLDKFGSTAKRHKSGEFWVENDKFNLNPVFGLFAGIPSHTSECFTLKIDPNHPSHIPLLTHAMINIVIINLTQNIEEPYKTIKNHCDEIRKLSYAIDWQEGFRTLVNNYINENPDNQSFDVSELIKSLKGNEKLSEHLEDLQKKFLNKLITITDTANERKENASPPRFQAFPVRSQLETPVIHLPSRTETDVVKELESEYIFGDDVEKENAAFLKTVNQRYQKLEGESHVLKNTKSILTDSEVASVEDAIYQEYDTSNDPNIDSNEELSTRLCWALMLYYSMPLNNIKSCLIGTPGIDFTASKMIGQVVIDLDLKIVHFPSPMQDLIDDSTVFYFHTPIPLERRVADLLQTLKESADSGEICLDKVLHPKSIDNAKSMKQFEGYRQYRITPKKINDYLWQNIQLNCRDEVKTAYLHGGSYPLLHMGTYYTELQITELQNLFLNTSKQVFKKAVFYEIDQNDKLLTGSVKRPLDNHVKTFFRETRKRLKELDQVKISTPEALAEYHNELALYTVSILNTATTHRPHQDPYFSLQNFIDERWVQISEKVIKKGVEGRLSVINDTCTEQLSAYCKHLKLFENILEKSENKQLTNAFKDLLSSKKLFRSGLALFFYIENNTLQPISKKHIQDYFKSISGIALKDNFYRHLLSSYMAEKQVPRIHIAAQMGHIIKGLESYSPNLDYSPVVQENILRPYLDELFNELKIIPFTPRTKRFYPISTPLTYQYKPWKLGPFKRLSDRRSQISDEDLQQINHILFRDKSPPISVRVNLATQKSHSQAIKSSFPNNTHRKLLKYYDFHKKYSDWRIEQKTVRKSPFDWHFPNLYQEGERHYQKLSLLFYGAKSLEAIQDQKTLRVILAVSALFSGNVRIREHLVEILNIPKAAFSQFKFSLATNITAPIGDRPWILSSLSTVIVQHIEDSEALNAFDESDINNWLSENHFPKLYSLIRQLNAYFQVHLPSYLNHYCQTPSLQSGVGKDALFALFEGLPRKTVTPLNSPIKSNNHNQTLEASVSKNSSSDFFKSLKKTLNQAREQKLEYAKTLTLINELEKQHPSLDLVTGLLVLWLKDRLHEGRLRLGSILDYYNRIFKFILLGFQDYSDIEDIDDETLQYDIYPQILEEMEKTISLDQRLYTSELKDFHQCLVKNFDFVPLHFEGGRAIARSRIESIAVPEVLRICCEAISDDDDISSEDKQHLAVALILYAKLGFRLSEIFYITPEDVNLQEKYIHLHGNRNQSLKRQASNRLLPYSQLLNHEEIQQLEELINKCHSNDPKRPFLFSFKERIKPKSLKQSVNQYLTNLLQNVTGEALTIKSLRKTFASTQFLRLTFLENNEWIIKEAGLESDANPVFQQQIESAEPHQKFWILANYIGHTSPQTTFESYALTLELANFYFSERLLEQQAHYKRRLKSLNTSKKVSESTIRNLRRYPEYTYAHHFSSVIYDPQLDCDWGTPINTSFLTTSVSIEKLEQVVVLLSMQYSQQAINDSTFVPIETISYIKEAYNQLLLDIFDGQIIPNKLEEDFIKRLTFANLNHKKWQKIRFEDLRASITDSSIKSKITTESNFYKLWKSQVKEVIKRNGEWHFSSQNKLEEMLGLFEGFVNGKSKLQIKLIGIKLSQDEIETIHFGDHWVKDERKIDDTQIPFTEFLVSVAVSKDESKNRLTCKKCLGYGVFFSVLKGLL